MHVGQTTYITPAMWLLSSGDGVKTVYVKFYTRWGQSSPVVSDSIILKTLTFVELKDAIAEIVEKIAQLKVQLKEFPEEGISKIPNDYRFAITLKYGQQSREIQYLQIFLKDQGLEIYAEGIISGWFGPLTKKAVTRFQEKYAAEVLAPWEITKGTGIVGKTTMVKLNELLVK